MRKFFQATKFLVRFQIHPYLPGYRRHSLEKPRTGETGQQVTSSGYLTTHLPAAWELQNLPPRWNQECSKDSQRSGGKSKWSQGSTTHSRAHTPLLHSTFLRFWKICFFRYKSNIAREQPLCIVLRWCRYIYFLLESHRIFQCCVLAGSIFVVSLCAFQVFVVFSHFPGVSLWQGLGGESDGTEG